MEVQLLTNFKNSANCMFLYLLWNNPHKISQYDLLIARNCHFAKILLLFRLIHTFGTVQWPYTDCALTVLCYCSNIYDCAQTVLLLCSDVFKYPSEHYILLNCYHHIILCWRLKHIRALAPMIFSFILFVLFHQWYFSRPNGWYRSCNMGM